MLPPAPARFSTTTCWPSVRLILSATVRAIASLPPPAAYGTTSVIGRDGKSSAAAAAVMTTIADIRMMARMRVGIALALMLLGPGAGIAHHFRPLGLVLV